MILDGDRERAIALLAGVGELIEANRRLEARVWKLEEQLRRSSRNSSLPPSQDPPSAPPRSHKPGSERRPGGQPGHEGRGRALLPLERVDEIVEHWPERCRACAHRFGEEERIDAAPVHRHQVSELPPIAVHAERAPPAPPALPGLRRRDARRASRGRPARLPSDRACRRPSPRSRSETASPGATRVELVRRPVRCRALGRFGRTRSCARRRGARAALRAAAPPPPRRPGRQRRRDRLAPARRQAHTLGRAHADDSGVPDRARPARARGQGAPRRGRSPGVACSDRWWAYNYLDPERRQLCWAHLIRDFTAHSEGHRRAEGLRRGRPRARRAAVPSLGRLPTRRRPRPAAEPVAPLKRELQTLLEHAARKSATQPLPPHLRQQPAQALAGALDVHPHRRRRADQQPRRARPARRRHLPQALLRQPIRARRAHDRTAPLRLSHLPPAATLALRLPHRRPHCQHPRRPHPRTRLTSRGLNAYRNARFAGISCKPSDGLEPSTPSLPCAAKRLPCVATGCGSACLSRFRARPICHRLPLVAPARLHKCSMPARAHSYRLVAAIGTL